MANRSVYVDHLRNVALFWGLTKKELALVASAGSEIDVAPGTALTEQGHRGSDAFVVLGGTFVVRRNGRKVAQLAVGDIVGELALLDDEPRSASVVCLTAGSVLVISRGHFRSLIDDVPALSHKLLAALAGRIRDLDSAVRG